MIDISDIRYLAAWLEGEGHFSISPSRSTVMPRLGGVSTDEDVIDRMREIAGKSIKSSTDNHHGRFAKKRLYRFDVTGPRAAGWMMTIYSFMLSRRKSQIRKALQIWRSGPKPQKNHINRAWNHAKDGR